MKLSSTSLTHTHMEIKYTQYRQKAQPCFFFSCSLFHFLLPPPPPFYSVPFSCKSSSSSHVDVPGTRWLPEMTILCKFRGQLSSFSFLYFISFFRTFLVFWILHTTTPFRKVCSLFSSPSVPFWVVTVERCRRIAGHQMRCKSSAGLPISRGWHHSFLWVMLGGGGDCLNLSPRILRAN